MLRHSRTCLAFSLALFSPLIALNACVSAPDAKNPLDATRVKPQLLPPEEIVQGSWAIPVSRSGGDAIREGSALRVQIPVDQFEDSDFNRFGFYDGGGRFEHAYGGDDAGFFSYLFTGSHEPLAALEIKARLSAESQDKGKPHETSDVMLSINGLAIGTQTVTADDSVGQVYTWKIADPEVLKALHLRAEGQGQNELRFAIASNARQRHGLCIYGRSLQKDDHEGQPITVSMQLTSASAGER